MQKKPTEGTLLYTVDYSGHLVRKITIPSDGSLDYVTRVAGSGNSYGPAGWRDGRLTHAYF
eukprot:3953145-Prorocentrum_lima.AAC.1